MLHEILLSLAGHPSPLLRADAAAPDADAGPAAAAAAAASAAAAAVFSPPERELLASVSHLSSLHVKVQGYSAQIASSHPSTICRAVAASVSSAHLAAFRRKVLDIEASVLRSDPALVGAYNIVPLTAVVGEFSAWIRRMEWLWEVVSLMLRGERRDGGGGGGGVAMACTGARIIDWLRAELQTGYVDIETTARSLVAVAETAWLKQVSAWVLYGRLPTFGSGDFFIQKAAQGSEEDFISNPYLLPSFVTAPTATSLLFIGKSLSQIRAKAAEASGQGAVHHLSSQLSELSKLSFPLDGAVFSRTITDIRFFLSRNILQKFLPLARVMEMLQVLRDFFLLGRGDFAMALSQQADEKMRSRWRKVDNMSAAYGRQEPLANILLKEGEVMSVLARTWGALGSLQGQHSDEDEGLEMARDIIRLTLAKSKLSASTSGGAPPSAFGYVSNIATTPFRNLLLSVPVVLTLDIPSPLDLFLSQSDVQTYTSINSYLLSVRKAHLRLTDLWKITALRRHWPPPPRPPYGSTPSGRAKVKLLRGRNTARSAAMRSVWATCSAVIFFLAETEAYLQNEVVAGLWDGFQQWLLTGDDQARPDDRRNKPLKLHTLGKRSRDEMDEDDDDNDNDDGDDIWLASAAAATAATDPTDGQPPSQDTRQPHDPQSLATAHRLYLRTLARRVLLTQQSFTDVLYELLVDVDRLVALVHRLQGIWSSMDLEADAGVVDAFVDLEREEADVRAEIAAVERRIKAGVEACIAELRAVEARDDSGGGGNALPAGSGDDMGGAAEAHDDGGGGGAADDDDDDEDRGALVELGEYVPRRVGRVDRLLMKLDFGTWFESSGRQGGSAGVEDYNI
ncbi:Spc97/Spc98 family protein [Gaeumannomyces tritici R3-111a-1]|uniref:Spindle pole body component n=1 Tax=Gaeumannomyces tritici (strain R3-111a-1) TaxID=644352 RepID=J3NPG5_GAET3|nr:Spc97/Spc98 family protein [Gaeumannomyces tritici R3-111a-1]EJT78070.1 Spc97/Spc98 family protein [Gaeumannomyces tritici R3-111a-1]